MPNSLISWCGYLVLVLAAVFLDTPHQAMASEAPCVTQMPGSSGSDGKSTDEISSLVNIVPTADVGCIGDDPAAVSAFDANIGVLGGFVDEEGFGSLTGQVVLPLGSLFGLQADGILGMSSDDVTFGQVAGHLFARDPEMGLLGAYASWSQQGSNDEVLRIGPEFELYLGSFSLAAIAGWQSEGKDHLFVDSRAGFYLSDNTQIYAGYGFDDVSIAKFGAEHMFNLENESSVLNGSILYAEGQIGENGYQAGFIGLKFDLGSKASSASPEYCPQPASLLNRNQRTYATQWWLPSVSGAQSSSNSPGGGPPQCTPPGGVCNLSDPGACCNLICINGSPTPTCG